MKTVGPKFEQQELKRLSEGLPARYKVLMAFNGEFTRPSMLRISFMLRCADEWSGLPTELRTHAHAVNTWRSGAAGCCAQYQLRVMRHHTYPFCGFQLLATSSALARVCAHNMLLVYQQSPCLLDHFWFHHIKTFPSVPALLCGKSLARVRQHALLVEWENISTECNNAQIRRSVVKAVQCKRLCLEDASADWCLTESAFEKFSIWGDKADEEAKDNTQTCRHGRGGGTCRAFVSKMSPQHRLPDGRPDFNAIMARWHVEKLNPDSELMQECEVAGRRGTLAYQALSLTTDSRLKPKMSAFGVVKPHVQKASAHHVECSNILSALEKHTGDEGEAAHSSGALALCLADDQSVGTIVSAQSGGGLREELAGIAKVCRHVAKNDLRKARADVDALRSKLKAPITVPGLSDALQEHLPQGADIHQINAGHPVLRVHDHCQSEAMYRSAALTKHRIPKFADRLLALWEKEHVMIGGDAVKPLEPVADTWYPAECHRKGYGVCICKGQGKVAYIAASRLATKLARLCSPKECIERTWLTNGFFVIRISSLWLHVGICYLNPRRPTFWRMKKAPDEKTFCGRACVEPLVRAAGYPDTISDVHAFLELDLQSDLRCEIWKLVGFDKEMQPWYPARFLTIEPLEKHTSKYSEPLHFWKGATVEVKEHEERLADKKRKEQQRKAASAAAAPGPKRQTRQKSQPGPRQHGKISKLLAIADVTAEPTFDQVDIDGSGYDPDLDWSDTDLLPPADLDEWGEPITKHAEQQRDALELFADPSYYPEAVGVQEPDSNPDDSDVVHLDFTDDEEVQDGGNDAAGESSGDKASTDASIPELPPRFDSDASDSTSGHSKSAPSAAPDASVGDAQAEPDGAASRKGRANYGRYPADRDLSYRQPIGCWLKFHSTVTRGDCWVASGPVGSLSSGGRKTTSRRVGPHDLTNEEAISQLETWLRDNFS